LGWLAQGAGALGALLIPVTLAWAHGGDPNLIHSCVQQASRMTRIVEPNDVCGRAEIAVDWPAVAPAPTTSSLQVVDADGKVVGPVVSLSGLNPVVVFKVDGQVITLQLMGDRFFGYDAVWFAGTGCTGNTYVQPSSSALPMTGVDHLGRVYVDEGAGNPALVTIRSYGFPNETNACTAAGFQLFVVPATFVGDLNSYFTAPFRVE
jgi:hypothetical protein